MICTAWNSGGIDTRPTRCVDGRLYQHRPQPDDPYFEVDRGQCHECGGRGCESNDEH